MEVVIEDYRQNVLQNQTLTSSGTSGVFTDFGAKEINLVINVTGPVTGSSPTIQFTIQEVDPGDGVTTFGSVKSSAIITGTGVYVVSLPVMVGGDVVVTWTVGGISPSFGGVYATVLNKVAGTSVLYDSSGVPVTGTAGSPATAVLTVQGVSGGQPSPVSGTVTSNQGTAAALAGAWPVKVTDGTNTLPTMDAVGRAGFQKITDGTNTAAVKAASTPAVATDQALVVSISPNTPVVASNPSIGVNTALAPTSSTQVGGSDGTNLQSVRVFDADSGAGSQYVLGVGLRKTASGGSVEAGTASDPLRVDPTGTTTQPVSGTVTSNQGTPNSIGNSWPVEITDGTNILGTPTHPVRTDPTGTTTQPVSGTVTANVGSTGGLALDATLTGGTTKAIVRGGAKGATVAADVTSTAEGADHQALDIQIYHGGAAKDPTQIRALTSADVVTAAQGTAAALAGYWPVRVTDGTNTLPTMDVAARAGFQKITDGTNTAAVKAASTAAIATDPALVVAVSPNNSVAVTQATAANLNATVVGTRTNNNAVPGATNVGALTVLANAANPTWTEGNLTALSANLSGAMRVTQNAAGALANWWAVRVTDGTNAMPTMDVAARRGFVTVTDGTNSMPTGDAVARSIFHQITDGTNGPVAVKAASTAPVATDNALVVVLSPNQQAIPISATPANAVAGLRGGTVLLGGGSSGSLNAIRATTYNEQSSGAQRSVSSASASDAAAGTGARTIVITYFTAAGVGPLTETVTLNGTTAVNTVNTDICYIEGLQIATVGSVGQNVGVITLFVGVGGAGGTIATIGVGNIVAGAGDGRTLWAQHYVATGKTCYLTSIAIGASASSTFIVRYKGLPVTSPELLLSGLTTASASFLRTYGAALQVVGPARMVIYANPSTNGVVINGALDFYEI